MNVEKNLYESPQVEEVELAVEQAVLSSSIDDMGYGKNNWE